MSRLISIGFFYTRACQNPECDFENGGSIQDDAFKKASRSWAGMVKKRFALGVREKHDGNC